MVLRGQVCVCSASPPPWTLLNPAEQWKPLCGLEPCFWSPLTRCDNYCSYRLWFYDITIWIQYNTDIQSCAAVQSSLAQTAARLLTSGIHKDIYNFFIYTQYVKEPQVLPSLFWRSPFSSALPAGLTSRAPNKEPWGIVRDGIIPDIPSWPNVPYLLLLHTDCQPVCLSHILTQEALKRHESRCTSPLPPDTITLARPREFTGVSAGRLRVDGCLFFTRLWRGQHAKY